MIDALYNTLTWCLQGTLLMFFLMVWVAVLAPVCEFAVRSIRRGWKQL